MARIYIHGKKVNELPHKQNPEGSDQLLIQDEQSNYSTLDELKNYIVDGYATEESVTQEVNTAIANLIGTAPESLDTLQELAEALNNDDDFAATVTNKLGEHDTAISNLQNADTELSNRITALESESTNDYTELENKPQINSITLEGNKTLNDLGIQPTGDYALKSEIPDESKFVERLDKAPSAIRQLVSDIQEAIVQKNTSITIDYAAEIYESLSDDLNSMALTYIIDSLSVQGLGTLKLQYITPMVVAFFRLMRDTAYYDATCFLSTDGVMSIRYTAGGISPSSNGIAITAENTQSNYDKSLLIETTGESTSFLAADGQYHTITIPEIKDDVILTLTTDLANGNGTITEDILTKITTARTNKQPVYVVNDRPALPVVELAIVTDGTNEESQGTIDLIMPTRIDTDGKATQVVYQIVGSASTTLTITTITREVQSDTTGLVKSDTITNIKVVTELPAEQEQNVLYIVTGEEA